MEDDVWALMYGFAVVYFSVGLLKVCLISLSAYAVIGAVWGYEEGTAAKKVFVCGLTLLSAWVYSLLLWPFVLIDEKLKFFLPYNPKEVFMSIAQNYLLG